MFKKILILTTAVICCTVVIGGGVWCSAVSESSPCTQVHILVKDSVQRQFVDALELEQYLAEADAMNTAELITKEELTQDDFNKNKAILDSLLSDTTLKETYGNKTIKRHREIA